MAATKNVAAQLLYICNCMHMAMATNPMAWSAVAVLRLAASAAPLTVSVIILFRLQLQLAVPLW